MSFSSCHAFKPCSCSLSYHVAPRLQSRATNKKPSMTCIQFWKASPCLGAILRPGIQIVAKASKLSGQTKHRAKALAERSNSSASALAAALPLSLLRRMTLRRRAESRINCIENPQQSPNADKNIFLNHKNSKSNLALLIATCKQTRIKLKRSLLMKIYEMLRIVRTESKRKRISWKSSNRLSMN